MTNKKKVLLVTQYFYPENFKSNDIAFELQKKGYQIDALVSIPNYPEGRYYKGYGIFRKRIQNIHGVKVYRSFQIPRGHNSNIKIVLNYLSYVISASIWCLFYFSFKKKYNAIIVHETSPIIQAYPAILLSKLKSIPLYMWVLDIWPDAMTSGGGIKDKRILTFMNKRVKRIYQSCDKLLISSKRMRESILEKGNFEDKIIYFPNWAEEIFENPEYFDIPKLPEGFKIMLAGNLGRSQNLDAVMDAALLLKNSDVKWILIGDGSKKDFIETFVRDNNLENNVFLLGRYPIRYMPTFYRNADAMLLTLRSEFPHLKMVVPAKLQSYMAVAKPVLAMIDGSGADIINESGCGYVVNAGDYKALVNVIKNKVLLYRKQFNEMGIKGSEYYNKYFQRDMCINHLCQIIDNER